MTQAINYHFWSVNSCKNILSQLSFLLFPIALNAQSFEHFPIKAIEDGFELTSPFAGGLNSPQFSPVDLDGNGLDDIYVFDKQGEIHLTFLAKQAGGELKYHYEPRFAKNFPACTGWVLLRDFDGDDIVDLFTYAGMESIEAISVFKGRYFNNKIAFDRVELNQGFTHNVLSWDNANVLSEIPVSEIDYPGIEDIDGDGDLDVLTYDPSGTYVHLFENQAIEQNYPLDSLVFILKDDCWGRFSEATNGTIINLGVSIDDCPEWSPSGIHPGSTLLPFDENGDGLVDVLIGDNSSPFLTKLTNGGTAQTAFMVEKDTAFPFYDIPAEIDLFVNAFLIDADQDGKKDLIASPNSKSLAEDTHVAWWYKNIGSNGNFDFEFQQSDWLVEEMFDFGTNSSPAVADVNADGLLDLVVGNYSFYLPGFDKDPRLFLLLNVGTVDEPAFTLADDNWLNFQQFDNYTTDFAPTFGDMDGDGDQDLFVGEKFGSLFYVENHADAGNPMEFNIITHHWQDIDVGQGASPQIMDLNRDGTLDLLIGERKGKLVFFPNQGTSTDPQFHPEPDELPNNPAFGGIETLAPFEFTGYSFPFLVDLDTAFIMITGSQSGKIDLYQFNSEQLNDSIAPIVENWGNMGVGLHARPILLDLNDDGVLEVIIGNQRGGLTAYSSTLNVDGTTAVSDVEQASNIKMYPNPVEQVLFVEESKNSSKLIYNALGRIVISTTQSSINVKDLPAGLYILKAGDEVISFIKK